MTTSTLRSHTHLQFAQANSQTKNCKRVCLPNRTDTATLDRQSTTEKEGRTHNRQGFVASVRRTMKPCLLCVQQTRFRRVGTTNDETVVARNRREKERKILDYGD